MTKRPLLIFNGKPRRYRHLNITMNVISGLDYYDRVEIDGRFMGMGARFSFSTRPSGRRVIWVSAEVDGGSRQRN